MKKLYVIIFLFSFSEIISQSIKIGETFTITSEILKETREYYVYTPESYSSEEAYPIIYVLDGDEYFMMMASAVRYFANRGFMPKSIVVGIDNSDHRDRDLTPTSDNYSPTGGGAEKFLSFLTEELMPSMASKYKIKPHSTLFGASYGGLFVLNTLFTRPNSFDNYIAISPSIFHDNGLIFQEGLQFFKKNNTNRKFVFLSLADEAWSEMRIHFKNTVQLFKNNANSANIRWHYSFYDEETHETTKLRGINDGLRKLHEFWFVPFYQRYRGAEGLIEHFEMLNEQYGYEISISEKLVNRIAYNNLREGKIKQARSLFQYNVDNFPSSANAYDSYGEFFEKQGINVEARKYYKLAIKAAKETNKNSALYEKNLNRVKEKM